MKNHLSQDNTKNSLQLEIALFTGDIDSIRKHESFVPQGMYTYLTCMLFTKRKPFFKINY